VLVDEGDLGVLLLRRIREDAAKRARSGINARARSSIARSSSGNVLSSPKGGNSQVDPSIHQIRRETTDLLRQTGSLSGFSENALDLAYVNP